MQRYLLHALARLKLGTLSLACVLAACGGGGDSGDGGASGETPGPVTSVSVVLASPQTADVVDANSPLSLRAQVRVDGSDAADGTVVQFTAGTGQTATGRTSAGVATASLTGLVTGRQQVQASATVGGRTGNAEQMIYVRPAPAPLQVLVPAYFYPTGAGASAWSAMTAGAASAPAGQITAILNPSDGIFSSADANITRVATAFTGAGGRLVGYVSSDYGTGARSLASVQANIDAYLAHYGPALVKGFFIDEMSGETGQLDFYRSIHRYIKARNPDLLVIGNPGRVPAAGYADVADVLTTFEGKGLTYGNYDPRTASFEWLYTLSNDRQASLVHNVSGCTAMQAAVQSAASARYHAGWLFVTSLEYEPSTGVGNPWAGLPGYWNAFLQAVRSANAGQAMPACP